jgi:2-polyprenyl-6-methoxyphenol hydroxylase-like FAD-dependent oxidoreductase
MARTRGFDVAIVGASVAGCTAARLFAQSGARVALIEKQGDPRAYKVTCTHAILPAAGPTIERLGLGPALEERGALRTGTDVWTPYGGWLRFPRGEHDGWGVTRHTLDPLLRDLAANTPGVELLGGWTATELMSTGPATITLEDRKHRRMRVRAPLLVGADGRNSTVARLTGVPGRVRPHNRFFYFGYWRGVKPATTSVRLWLQDPDGGGAQFPNEDGLTMLVSSFPRSQAAEVRADHEAAYVARLAGLCDGPDLTEAERVSKVMGKLEMPNVYRLGARPGLAFAGDAAVAADPLFGVGISFAFQTGEWLADAASHQLDHPRGLEAALRRYRRRTLVRLAPHHLQMASYARGRRLNLAERHMIRRAGSDPVVAGAVAAFFTRERTPSVLMQPRVLRRLLLPRAA